jgi:hypothetical protein
VLFNTISQKQLATTSTELGEQEEEAEKANVFLSIETITTKQLKS